MSAADNSFKEYVRRAINYDHMDLEYTFWQMFYLCVAPARVYRTTKLHKQTKNQWARDDPAFVVVLACMVAMASLAYAIAFRVSSVWQYVRIVVSAIMFDFLLVGVVVASASWWFANARLRVPPTVHNVEQRVEWLYAFDVHCNSYFPLFLIVYVTQFFLVPVLLKPIFLSTFLANTLYGVHSGTACMRIPSACPHAHSWLTTRPSAGAVAVAAVCWCFVSCSACVPRWACPGFACCYYWYITFLGYQVLPFLSKTTIFLYPCVAVGGLYIVSLVTRWNVSVFVLTMYFGHE
jgi:hypothetical protein